MGMRIKMEVYHSFISRDLIMLINATALKLAVMETTISTGHVVFD